MTQDTQAALAKVPHRVTEPKLIPAERYYDEDFFKQENEKLWPHVWQMACRLEEIPHIGDYTEYTILDKSVIVVRTKDGVKAFHNACRHRGVQLVEGPGNCAKTGFICPFHGWRWNAEGKNTFVFGKAIFDEALLDHALIDLPQVRCEFWAGCAFINFDDDAPGLIESLGPVVDILDARHVDRLKMDWWYGTVLPTNWKLAMEAFMEGYHVMRTHPQLHDLMPGNSYGPDGNEPIPTRNMDSRMMVNNMIDFYARLSSGMAGMVHQTEVDVIEKLRDMEVPEDPMHALGAFFAKAQADITADGLARGAPMFDIPKVNQEKPFHDVEFMFPHFFLLPSFAAMSSYRIRPLTAETCLFEIWSLVLRPEGEDYDTPKAPTMLPYDSEQFPEIPMQDYSNLPRQQRGLHAGGFTHMRLSHEQEGMISNYQRLVDGYLAGLDAETLRKGQNAVNSGYNAPIVDIGF
ncbi:aromatic ring-hydroxylating oxygenase subunit alpha [Novosphingobium sp. JCM 18896]|uniref:aromatic ring-hydroxylating oxygenase subunit alpha n=1 Tax=Novosphingobium sp. JCM 18896 TaxID=2989731 RepID=UPI0022224F88|nr:aromatic ring-hydroxylating dioxygenase subunit alpha [Novosphingobium sp. JCM 18896]MCW1428337.1 aromatic ring-hydroxylating dioxygenase subunit alpha [Novosphingobium sp. JCM 18896]